MLKQRTSLGKVLLLCSAWAIVALASVTSAQTKLYRYINDRGVVVIDYTIPSEYVPKGYEVLNSNGQVIEKIEPEPTGEELAQKQKQQKILNDYLKLKLRYSDIEDIEQARDRKLSSLATNIAILKGNIKGLNKNMEALVSQATRQERMGRAVSNSLLEQIDDTKTELDIAQHLLSLRVAESEKTTKRYENEMVRFSKGEALAKKMNYSSNTQ